MSSAAAPFATLCPGCFAEKGNPGLCLTTGHRAILQGKFAAGRIKLWAVLAVSVVLIAGVMFVKARKDPAVLYAEGLAAYQKNDYVGALAQWQSLADKGFANAQFQLGVMYDEGHAFQTNEAEAVNWFRKAAEQGHADAQSNLGWMYGQGRGVPKNQAEAVNWYRKAAEQGHANAQFNLGVSYDQGLGVPKNEAEAINWYRKAAEQGDAYAQYNLGVSYWNGEGVQNDEVQAVTWLRKAAAQGNAQASTALQQRGLQ